jgi:hypothetical protein
MRSVGRCDITIATLLAIGLSLGCFRLTTADAATVSLSPTSSSTSVGQPLTLNLNISGLGSGTALGAFDISVGFNSSMLSFQSAAFGDPVLGDQLDLSNAGLNGPTATSGIGTVDLIEVDLLDSPATLLSSQAHNFTLAALSFYSLAAGTTPVSISINSLADQNGNPFTANTQNASVTVQSSPVPVPAAAWLLGSGLLGLGAMARRRRVVATVLTTWRLPSSRCPRAGCHCSTVSASGSDEIGCGTSH